MTESPIFVFERNLQLLLVSKCDGSYLFDGNSVFINVSFLETVFPTMQLIYCFKFLVFTLKKISPFFLIKFRNNANIFFSLFKNLILSFG